MEASSDCLTVDDEIVENKTVSDYERLKEEFESSSAADNIISRVASAQEYLERQKYLVEYERQMFMDIYHNDGLVICAKGISYDQVLMNFLKVYGDPANLILVVNCDSVEEEFYRKHLDPKIVHDVATSVTVREKVYLEGGIQFISTRILVVDLLKKRMPIELITGIVVLRAHDVIESCQEAFALRLYRRNNKTGFIKAFSKSPESFTYGYGHVEKVMRNLFLRELFIWPRFHALIKSSLKPFEPTVTELHVPMTNKMTLLQTHVLEIMNYLVKELKRLNPRIDMEEITVENCLTKNFHKILQSQLDCVWHQLSAQTKLIIADLKVMRSIMISVIYNDSVSLYSLVRRYRTTDYAMSNSGWVLLDSSEQMFMIAKSRVFNDKDEFDPEWCPKWKPLTELLRVEIPGDMNRTEKKDGIGVLILCKDSRTCLQLNQYLTMGPEKYLFHTALKNEIHISKIAEDYKKMTASIEFGRFQFNEQQRQELDKCNTKRKKRRKDESMKKAEDAEYGEEEEESTGSETTLKSNPFCEKEDEDLDVLQDSYLLTMTQDAETSQYQVSQIGDFDSTQFSEFSAIVNSSESSQPIPIVCIQTFKTIASGSLSLEKILKDMNPRYVIMYHCDVAAIRQLEVFEAKLRRPPSERMKVFFLLHAQTVEEQSYLTSLRREKQAFELIIETKQSMVIETDREGKMVLDETTEDTEIMTNEETRQAGGQIAKEPKKQSQIIIDMREFRSELPCLIHKRGVEVLPVTITIGDYILTPDICVERKSISDLIGSLNSGRLYNQCVQMVRYYAKPVLLIEFDQNKPFHLQGRYMMTESGQNMDIVKKLQLLTLSFPKLRLVWSPSPYATAQLFIELKQNKPEPDAEAAAAVGSDESAEITDKYNPVLYDFLLRLPGINTRNIGNVMKKGQSLKNLLKLSKEELEEILGSKLNATMLFEILHESHKPSAEEIVLLKPKFVSKFKRARK